MARDRGCFIDQSQSMNLFVSSPTIPILSSMHMYSWEQGLKTGIYYLRSRSSQKAQKSLGISNNNADIAEKLACSIEAMKNGEECDVCSA